MGLEPTREYTHKILSLARLPIPTLPRSADRSALDYTNTFPSQCQHIF